MRGAHYAGIVTKRVIKKAIAATAPALMLGGAIAMPSRPGQPQEAPTTHPVIRARDHEHEDQPHTPETEWSAFSGPESEIHQDGHVLVADDPRYGVLNGTNIIGYCRACPVAALSHGMRCSIRCPGEMPRLSLDV